MSPRGPKDRRSGKISADEFSGIVLPHLGALRSEVLVGPSHGVDVGVIDLGDGRVLALTSDPFFVAPELGWDRAGWFAIQIVASDAATSGLAPTYCTIDLNLPESMSEVDLAELWTAVHQACDTIGMSVVTGHTGRYESCSFPMLGGATVLCIGPREQYITPQMARVGDDLLVTKGAAIEATAMFGVAYPALLRSVLGPEIAAAAERLFWQCSVVQDALLAVQAGVHERGVTSMHDATERGLWGGVHEIADAAEVGLLIDQNAIPLRPEVCAVCDLFDMDPFTASSEGTLIMTVRPSRTSEVIARLEGAQIEARRIGEVVPEKNGVVVVRDGREEALPVPTYDPFWPAFAGASALVQRGTP